MYEGFRKLQHSLGALDARNFGIAEARLRDAEQRLEPLREKMAGLTKLTARLEATHIAVAENLAAQRGTVVGLLSELDGLIEQEAAERGVISAERSARTGPATRVGRTPQQSDELKRAEAR